MRDEIDLKEGSMYKSYPEILDILLVDRSSKKNIKWCTDNYLKNGISPSDYLTVSQLTQRKSSLIKPRILKSQAEQKRRSRFWERRQVLKLLESEKKSGNSLKTDTS